MISVPFQNSTTFGVGENGRVQDWKAPSGNKWTVPVGGGAGKILRLGRQAVNTYIQAFNDVVRPHEGGTWPLRLQIQLLFPK